LGERDFVAGRYDTDYVTTHWGRADPPEITDGAAVAAALAGIARLRSRPRPISVEAAPWARSAREDMLR
jgi:hypothetical protein